MVDGTPLRAHVVDVASDDAGRVLHECSICGYRGRTPPPLPCAGLPAGGRAPAVFAVSHGGSEREAATVPPAGPWPENTTPAAEEWRDWFLTLSPETQIEAASHVGTAFRHTQRCLLENHYELRAENAYLQQRANRLHLAWESARRYRRRLQLVEAIRDDLADVTGARWIADVLTKALDTGRG